MAVAQLPVGRIGPNFSMWCAQALGNFHIFGQNPFADFAKNTFAQKRKLSRPKIGLFWSPMQFDEILVDFNKNWYDMTTIHGGHLGRVRLGLGPFFGWAIVLFPVGRMG